VSLLPVIGTAQWGSSYGISGAPAVDEARAAAILDVAAEFGVTMLDTARSYPGSEELLGRHLGEHEGWQVISKLDAFLDPHLPSKQLGRLVDKSIHDSLSALRRTRLEGLLFHRWRLAQLAGDAVWDRLIHIQAAGHVGFIGASASTPNEAFEIVGHPKVEAIQVAASVLDRRLDEGGFFEQEPVSGKRIFIRSVFLQGAAFLPPERLPSYLADLRGPLQRLRQWCSKNDVSVRDACLGYVSRLGGHLVLGFDDAQQAREDLACLTEVRQRHDLWAELPDVVGQLPPSILDPVRWQRD
jgi:aryl-alcohol dehydrogenase-like predicted oxidoreductase